MNKKIFWFLCITSLLFSFCSKEHKTATHKSFVKTMSLALMVSDHKSPKLSVRKKSAFSLLIAAVPTAVPAFIGYTEKAAPGYGKPTKITSLKEYEDLFGRAPLSKEGSHAKIKATISINGTINITMPKLKKLMYYSMQLFFNNGGKSCYIVALGNGVNHEAAINKLILEDEPTLIVLPDVIYENYSKLYQKVLSLCAMMKDRFAILDVPMGVGKTITDDSEGFRTAVGSKNLKYAAAYYPYVKTSIPYQYNDSDVVITQIDPKTGREKVDANGNVIITALKEIKSGEPEKYNKIKKAIGAMSLTLPPSGAIAGVYAQVDRDRGVWKAPANISLNSVLKPSIQLTEKESRNLNMDLTSGKSINTIRSFPGKGTLVWGARTLAGNDKKWRYVSVRRFYLYMKKSIKKASAFAVFEPNNAKTWLMLRTMVEGFLKGLWKQGALAGANAKDAYFVQCGLGTTMTQKDIDEGRLIIKIGFAAIRPGDFITFEVMRKIQEQ